MKRSEYSEDFFGGKWKMENKRLTSDKYFAKLESRRFLSQLSNTLCAEKFHYIVSVICNICISRRNSLYRNIFF